MAAKHNGRVTHKASPAEITELPKRVDPLVPTQRRAITTNPEKTIQILKNTIGELNGQLAQIMGALEDSIEQYEALAARIAELEGQDA